MQRSSIRGLRLPRWKYLRKARLEEGSDWFWTIGRAYLFVLGQMRRRNYYAATIIEASLVEYSLKFLLILGVHSKSNTFGEAEGDRLTQESKTIFDEPFARNIGQALGANLISKRLGSRLDKFREMRNDMIHEAFFSGINGKSAREFVSVGHGIMDVLGNKIGKLIP